MNLNTIQWNTYISNHTPYYNGNCYDDDNKSIVRDN